MSEAESIPGWKGRGQLIHNCRCESPVIEVFTAVWVEPFSGLIRPIARPTDEEEALPVAGVGERSWPLVQ